MPPTPISSDGLFDILIVFLFVCVVDILCGITGQRPIDKSQALDGDATIRLPDNTELSQLLVCLARAKAAAATDTRENNKKESGRAHIKVYCRYESRAQTVQP